VKEQLMPLVGLRQFSQRNQLTEQAPLHEEVADGCDPYKEHFQERNYRVELAVRKLKRC
jgi:hypothetical protein